MIVKDRSDGKLYVVEDSFKTLTFHESRGRDFFYGWEYKYDTEEERDEYLENLFIILD